MAARFIEITTPLDPDLLFYSMRAREELSRPSEFQLELLSDKNDLPLDKILGKNVTVTLDLETAGSPDVRYFNGFVTRFSQGGMIGRYYRYMATVRTWNWFMS